MYVVTMCDSLTAASATPLFFEKLDIKMRPAARCVILYTACPVDLAAIKWLPLCHQDVLI